MDIFERLVLLILILYDIVKSHEINSPVHMTLSWSQEVGKEFKKYYDIKPPVYDILVGESNHSFALLRCKNSRDAYPKMCNLTIQTHTEEHQVFSSSCEIKPPSEHNTITVLQHSVTFLRDDRVLVSWKEHHKIHGWRMSSQVIFKDSCHASQFIHVPTRLEDNFVLHTVVKFPNSFDIIFGRSFYNEDYLKLTYDYNGISLTSGPFPLKLNNGKFTLTKIYPIIFNNSKERVVLVGRNDDNDDDGSKMKIYSPITGWFEVDDISHGETLYANSNGYSTFCWRQHGIPNELFCKRLNDDTSLDFEFKPYYTKLPLIYNNPNGNLMLINRGIDDKGIVNVYVDEIITDIKCKRLVQIPFPARSDLLAFSMSRTHFCYSYLFKDAEWDLAGNPSFMYYALGTECVKQPHHSTYKHGRCGHKYF